MKELVWTELALKTYLEIVDYLFEHWTNKEIDAFQGKTNTLLRNLSEFNFLCPASKLLPYRKCFVNYHTSLIYAQENDKIALITFLHNKSAHNY